MIDLEASRWQALMTEACEGWTDGTTYGAFLATLDRLPRVAVLLGTMNYQIGNGGVTQWVDNGYACHARDVLAALWLIGTPRAREWANLLSPFVREHVNAEATARGIGGRDYWKGERSRWDDEDDEDDEDEGRAAAQTLDGHYHGSPFHAELLLEIETYLSR